MLNEFLIGAMFIGVVQVIDGVLLAKQRHLTMATSMTSFIEFTWVWVCVYALFAIPFPSWTLALPSFFISYSVLGWWHSLQLMDDIEDFDDLDDLEIPQIYAITSIAFGCMHFLTSGMAFWQL